MRNLLQKMSKEQYAWLIAGSCLAVALLCAGVIVEAGIRQEGFPPLSLEMTIGHMAPKLGVGEKALARELGLPVNASPNEPLKNLHVGQEKFEQVIRHLLGHRSSPLKYSLFAVFVLWGWLFLVHLGRPENMQLKERRQWYPKSAFLGPLILAVGLAGLLTGKSPNPMEGTVKVFKAMAGRYPDIWEKAAALAFFAFLATLGNKLVCGWACPFGALQELLYSLPLAGRIKRYKPPFAVTNAIRGMLFLVMLLLLFGIVGGKKGFVIYHYLNPFNLFNLEFETGSILITVLAAIGFAPFFYRPFCQMICPFGFISWLAERMSLYRVTVNLEARTQCGTCAKACPSPAMAGRLKGKPFPADCFSCARCLNACPVDAIRYASIFRAIPSRPESRV